MWPKVACADLLFGQINRTLGNKYCPHITNPPEHFRLTAMPNTMVQYLHFVDRSGIYFVIFVKFHWCLFFFPLCIQGLDLRVEHTHCFSHHGIAGHCYIDTTPDIAEYLGYYSPAEFVYRIDRPEKTHCVGRN